MDGPKYPKLTFYGAAQTVTGSKTLLRYKDKTLLIDCGLYQGLKQWRVKNREPMPFDVKTVDEVILTHAHLDHCGALPLLVKQGYHGPIHCTKPTADLVKVILSDSGKIQEEEAERANRYGYSKHTKARPLYTVQEALKVMEHIVTHDYSEWVFIGDDRLKFQFHNAGHILGSAMVEMEAKDKTIVFTGDLGRSAPILLHPPKKPGKVDFLITESTYGDRLHPGTNAIDELDKAVNEALSSDGILIIPTFAVERAQEIIFLLSQLRKQNRIPKVPIYLDSPMGTNATKVFLNYPEWHKLTKQDCMEMMEAVHLVRDAEQSKGILNDPHKKIVLAGSGMMTGGRVLFYLEKYLSDPGSTILLAGYQSTGTRGRDVQEGAHELKFFGRWHKVKANIRSLSSLSAHADQAEILSWIKEMKQPPRQVFINHGEPQAAHTLKLKIGEETGAYVNVAVLEETHTLK